MKRRRKFGWSVGAVDPRKGCLTADEWALVEEKRAAGMPDRAIADMLGRSLADLRRGVVVDVTGNRSGEDLVAGPSEAELAARRERNRNHRVKVWRAA